MQGRPFQRGRNEACTYHDSITNSRPGDARDDRVVYTYEPGTPRSSGACFEGFSGEFLLAFGQVQSMCSRAGIRQGTHVKDLF